jgi:hypothetical protein
MAVKTPNIRQAKPKSDARQAKPVSRRGSQDAAFSAKPENAPDDAVLHGFAPEQAEDFSAEQGLSTISVPELVTLLWAEGKTLLQAEADVVKAKADVAAKASQRAAIWVAIAIVALVAASLASLYAAIAFLTPWLGTAGAAALVAIIWIVIGIFGILQARGIMQKTIKMLKD